MFFHKRERERERERLFIIKLKKKKKEKGEIEKIIRRGWKLKILKHSNQLVYLLKGKKKKSIRVKVFVYYNIRSHIFILHNYFSKILISNYLFLTQFY